VGRGKEGGVACGKIVEGQAEGDFKNGKGVSEEGKVLKGRKRK